jgi:pyruvate kinase
MQKIISNIEENNYPFHTEKMLNGASNSFLSDAVCNSACVLAKQSNAVGIVSMTLSGYTAFEISSHRPHSPIFIFTSNETLLNTLSLVWGVRGFFYDKFESTDLTITEVNDFLKKHKLIKKGDVIINTAAIPMERKGKTNMLKITVID